jgi:hypothetical protein
LKSFHTSHSLLGPVMLTSLTATEQFCSVGDMCLRRYKQVPVCLPHCHCTLFSWNFGSYHILFN